MSLKPILVYVDDEPHNLTVFEAAMPEDWEIRSFDSPLKALDAITKMNPWVVVTDQRMPGMAGVNFLEIVKRTHPEAKRVLVTGYSEEDLVIDSIRKAGVHDFIRKPWDVDELFHRIKQVVDTYLLEVDLREKSKALEAQNVELTKLAADLATAKEKEETLRIELESWAPPFLLKALKDSGATQAICRDLAMIAFDIIGSSKVHEMFIDGRSVRSLIIQEFSESVIKHGGWRESHSGDSAYAHFGLIEGTASPAESALAVASEFRTYLRSLSIKHNLVVESGVALHFAKAVKVHLHTAEFDTPNGRVIQKSFDTSSPDVDLLHRIEKLAHQLPGSNIVISEAFLTAVGKVHGAVELGHFVLKGQKDLQRVFMKCSDRVTPEDLDKLRALQVPASSSEKKAA